MIEELRAKLYHISQQDNQEDILRISQLLDEALNEFESKKKNTS